ncbi:MAG: response regulator transcription factor [Candidatus Geothermincolales bacterium]
MAIILMTGRRENPPFLAALARLGDLVVCEREGKRRPAPGDLVILDLVPEGSEWGEVVLRFRREHPGAVLVAVLEERQLAGFDEALPLDDFLVEGCGEAEVEARLKRLLRESRDKHGPEGLVIDAERYEVRLDGEPVELTYKEFELLRYLYSNPGKVLTREALLRQVWGYDYFGGSRTVDVHIRRIRSKIEKGGHAYIRTVRGVGYMFDPGRPPSGSPGG